MVGIESNEVSEMKMFPNPANEFVYFTNVKAKSIFICNLLGEVVKEYKVYSNETKIILSDYDEGLYIIRYNEDGIYKSRMLNIIK